MEDIFDENFLKHEIFIRISKNSPAKSANIQLKNPKKHPDR